jgi:hypothetical protein
MAIVQVGALTLPDFGGACESESLGAQHSSDTAIRCWRCKLWSGKIGSA